MGAWANYFEKTKNHKHDEFDKLLECSDLLLKLFTNPKNKSPKALDLGCGTGRDTLYLLQNGYEVTAVDAEPEALNYVKYRLMENGISLNNVKLIASKIEDLRLAEQSDLIVADLSLSFVNPKSFRSAWTFIVQHLKFGGYFFGQIFGLQHTWSANEQMTFLNLSEVYNLFRGLFNINIFIEEGNPDQQTALEGKKYWQQYNIVAARVPFNPEKPLKIEMPLMSFQNYVKSEKERINVDFEEKQNKDFSGFKRGFLLGKRF